MPAVVKCVAFKSKANVTADYVYENISPRNRAAQTSSSAAAPHPTCTLGKRFVSLTITVYRNPWLHYVPLGPPGSGSPEYRIKLLPSECDK